MSYFHAQVLQRDCVLQNSTLQLPSVSIRKEPVFVLKIAEPQIRTNVTSSESQVGIMLQWLGRLAYRAQKMERTNATCNNPKCLLRRYKYKKI